MTLDELEDARRSYASHLAAHAVVEVLLTGKCRHDLDLDRPCPWCGEQPPLLVDLEAPVS